MIFLGFALETNPIFIQKGGCMSKICPETGEKVIYLTCLECETKSCKNTCRKEESDEKNK